MAPKLGALLAFGVFTATGCPRAEVAVGTNGDGGVAQFGEDGGLFTITPADCIYGSPCPAGQICIHVDLEQLVGAGGGCGTCQPKGASGYCGGCPAQRWGCAIVPPGCRIGQLCGCSPYFTSAPSLVVDNQTALHQASPPCYDCEEGPNYDAGTSQLFCEWYQ